MKRACIDCGKVTTNRTRCSICSSRKERQRGSPTRRGYGTAHQKARADLKAFLPGFCGYGCGRLLYPDGKWVAAHVVDGDEDAGWIASCAGCNERAKRRGRGILRGVGPNL